MTFITRLTTVGLAAYADARFIAGVNIPGCDIGMDINV